MLSKKEYLIVTFALVGLGLIFHAGGLASDVSRCLGWGVNVCQVVWATSCPFIMERG